MRGAAQRRSRRVRQAWNSVHGRRTTEFPSAALKRQWTAGREPGGLSLRGVFVAGRRKLVRRHDDDLDLGLRGVDPMAIRTLKEMGDDVAHRQRGSGPLHVDVADGADGCLQVLERSSNPVNHGLCPATFRWSLSLHGIVAKIEQCKRVLFTKVVRGASARSGSRRMKLNFELNLGRPHQIAIP